MSLSKNLFSLASLLTLTVAVHAQGTFGTIAIQPSLVFVVATPPVLPSVQSRLGNYEKTIGNSNLGGSVNVYAAIVRQKSGTYELGHAGAEFRAVGKLLGSTMELAEIVGNASNVMNNGVQNRSGSFRIDVLGYPVINSSFTNNSTFGASTSTFNLFPGGGVSQSFPCGPVSVTLAGNAGCTFSRSANWLLPAATASCGMNATGSAYAFADAHVGFGIPGFSVGGGCYGKLLEQTLSGNVTANAVYGLSGNISYQLKPLTLTLYAYAQAIWTWTTPITSWSMGLISMNLI